MEHSLEPSKNKSSKIAHHKIIDAWYPITEDGQTCIYCRCLLANHTGIALMYSLPHQYRRQRRGVSVAWCKDCAATKNTHQVTCYAIDDENN